MSIRATPKQIKIADFYRRFELQHGYAPILQEVASAMGIAKVTLYEHVCRMIAKGILVKHESHTARSISYNTASGVLAPVDHRSQRLELINEAKFQIALLDSNGLGNAWARDLAQRWRNLLRQFGEMPATAGD